MTSMIEVYWNYLGRYLGHYIGKYIDLLPFAVSEMLLQLSLWFCVLICFCFIMGHQISKYYWIGPIILFIMVGSQGISSLDWVPTAHREKVHERLSSPVVEKEDLKLFLDEQQKLLNDFPSELYKKAKANPDLKMVNESVGKALKALDLKSGREVTAIKKLWGVTRVLGLAYGGPAYHDVITSEVVLATKEDYPASKAWRWMCVVHEVVHAQGFTREMDTEIITYLALKLSDDPLLKALSAWMVLLKTGQIFDIPDVFKNEWEQVREQRDELHQPMVKLLKRVAEKLTIQNSNAKYGSVKKGTSIPLNHEFFSSLVTFDKLGLN